MAAGAHRVGAFGWRVPGFLVARHRGGTERNVGGKKTEQEEGGPREEAQAGWEDGNCEWEGGISGCLNLNEGVSLESFEGRFKI
jgi:hypothetical protein